MNIFLDIHNYGKKVVKLITHLLDLVLPYYLFVLKVDKSQMFLIYTYRLYDSKTDKDKVYHGIVLLN